MWLHNTSVMKGLLNFTTEWKQILFENFITSFHTLVKLVLINIKRSYLLVCFGGQIIRALRTLNEVLFFFQPKSVDIILVSTKI